MKQTGLFFSQVIDLRDHTLPAHIMDALHTVYSACRAVNRPNKYDPAIELIIIDAVHQDYDFERLKRDLRGAIREEAGVLE